MRPPLGAEIITPRREFFSTRDPGVVPAQLPGECERPSEDGALAQPFPTLPPRRSPYVCGCEGLYEVSHWRFVRSLLTGKILKPWSARGYLRVRLCKDGKSWKRFCRPHPSGQQTRHFYDNDPACNLLHNLAWGTKSEDALNLVWLGTHNEARKTACPRAAVRTR